MWYRTGSVAVTNGSATVVGAGTDFVANSSIGEVFLGPDGRVYEIGAIPSATQLTIIPAYQGATAGGQAYGIQPTSSFARDLALAAGVLLNSFSAVRDGVGQGLFSDGTVAAPGIRFAGDQDTGLRRSNANEVAIVTGGVDRVYFSGAGMEVSGRVIAAAPDAVGVAAPALGTIPASTAAFMTNANRQYGLLVGQFGNTGDTWMQAQRIDGQAVAYNLNLQPSGGRVGVGTTSPASAFEVAHADSNLSAVTVTNKSTGASVRLATAIGVTDAAILYTPGPNALRFGTNNLEAMRLDAAGNLLVGAASGSTHTFQKGSGLGGAILNIANCGTFYNCDATGFNGAASALKLWMNSTTGRSISASGTINASGADYAEYVRKSLACGTILKGDVCGIDSNGQLTRTWADARRYVVKSTDPNLVGGDTWAAHLGSRPEAPLYAAPAYDGPAEPTKPVEPAAFVTPVIEMPVQPVRGDGEDDDAYLLRLAAFLNDRDATIAQAQAAAAAQIEAAKAQVAYAAAVDQYQADLAAYRDAQAAYRTAIDAAEAAHAVALAAHGEALTAWEAELEAARQTVDRIAFSGQVPVNVDADTLAACEAALADGVAVYLVAVARGAGIGVTAVREADMTLPLYMRRVGAVWAIRDGRPWIDVQHG